MQHACSLETVCRGSIFGVSRLNLLYLCGLHLVGVCGFYVLSAVSTHCCKLVVPSKTMSGFYCKHLLTNIMQPFVTNFYVEFNVSYYLFLPIIILRKVVLPLSANVFSQNRMHCT